MQKSCPAKTILHGYMSPNKLVVGERVVKECKQCCNEGFWHKMVFAALYHPQGGKHRDVVPDQPKL